MPSGLYPVLPSSEQTNLLDRILERAVRGSVVVFDLDGTLMDNRPRTCAIMHELAAEWHVSEAAAANQLRSLRYEQVEYSLQATFNKCGIERSDLVAPAEQFWKSRFFRDDHLKHDTALEGAVSFARACRERGAILAYVTGRDLPHMSIGTFRSLRDLGFPIGITGTELILKPNAEIPDEDFKRTIAPELSLLGDIIAAFDNEPGNCNLFLDAYPNVESVLLDTQHAPHPPKLQKRVSIIEHFVR